MGGIRRRRLLKIAVGMLGATTSSTMAVIMALRAAVSPVGIG